jgi:hypothetical protein
VLELHGQKARLANYKRENRRLRDNRELASPVAISVLGERFNRSLRAIARDTDFYDLSHARTAAETPYRESDFILERVPQARKAGPIFNSVILYRGTISRYQPSFNVGRR